MNYASEYWFLALDEQNSTEHVEYRVVYGDNVLFYEDMDTAVLSYNEACNAGETAYLVEVRGCCDEFNGVESLISSNE